MARQLRELRDRKAGLSRPAFQFSINSILVVTAVIATSILAIQEIHSRFGPAAAAVVILAILSVFAHIAGAAIGDRLRASEELPDATEMDTEEIESRLKQPVHAQVTDFAPATQLSRQKALERRPLYYAVGTGATTCAILASIVLVWFMWDDLAIVNVLFGACSAAVIGGLLGFCACSFYQVVRSALSEAEKHT